MLENLRRAFSEAVDNFNRELERESVPDAVDGLLKGMEREAVAAKSSLEALTQELSTARERAAAEKREAEICRRREDLARKIGDTETADIAAQFGERHERRHKVLAEKRDAIEAELQLLESEFKEMLQQIKDARANRSSLEAAAGRTRAKRSMRGAGDLFDELDRMADKMGDSGGETQTDRVPFDDIGEFDQERERRKRKRREELIDAKLAELKRRMGRR